MIRRSIVVALGLLVSTLPAWADSLKITSEDGSELAVLDRQAIEALGLVEIETKTPWTEDTVRFEGVSITTILSEFDVSDVSVTGHAVNDYAVSLDAEIIEKYKPIIATRMDGVPMTIDDKGPFWIMFDFDGIGEQRSPEVHSLSVWYLVELEVE